MHPKNIQATMYLRACIVKQTFWNAEVGLQFKAPESMHRAAYSLRNQVPP